MPPIEECNEIVNNGACAAEVSALQQVAILRTEILALADRINEIRTRGLRSISQNGATKIVVGGKNIIGDTVIFDTTELLSDDGSSEFGVRIFLNAAARANNIPAIVGQLGIQVDTNVIYRATATTSGAWTKAVSTHPIPGPYADDAAASAGGVATGEAYYETTSGIVNVRLT